MYPIYFITSNEGKLVSMRKWVEPLGIRVHKYRKRINIPERKLSSVEETAKFKAIDICATVAAPFVVQDSGFYLAAIPGFPGPDINRALSTIGIAGLLEMIAGEVGKRECYFEDVLAFWSPTLEDRLEPVLFKSRVYGRVATQSSPNLREEAWSALWTIFIPTGFDSTLAAMSKEEQRRFADETRNSKESNSFLAFAEWIRANIHYLYLQKSLDELLGDTRRRAR